MTRRERESERIKLSLTPEITMDTHLNMQVMIFDADLTLSLPVQGETASQTWAFFGYHYQGEMVKV